MGRLSVGGAPCSRRPLDAGRCCGLRGCHIRPPSIPSRSKCLTNFLFCAWGQVLPSMVLLGRARALRACGATTHPCAWVAWCMKALGFCPGEASLRAVGGVLARYQAREHGRKPLPRCQRVEAPTDMSSTSTRNRVPYRRYTLGF